ncbi:hypothetical protein B0S90_2073 [Caldicellulosiruptor bescii]|uniref:DUF6873 domain-containing protein n=2 Tax=Caldicellulosiruptor bescii TaxID=31899 RepID=B9MKK1_CALBD|nr:hypothetical protein [Caldicellulosiruptor bescii]ACM60859.1 conserved hypothetical protein [Caldicellulosiruptor bescii DSM 6725]PBC89323.1 hypothetical protein B0S87_2414 [Caldicellulosiruptor bescii]PBC91192.1 hypothetical protein B0S89_1574 [Caldicellulosiruptor bescii]PBD03394.1 hypothetical protein B0S85_0992 [Caldicellulosiruptor bescii]PBD06991.1 hypothetical protein B0S90_2073 [Caldicellulosiruptor bescii]
MKYLKFPYIPESKATHILLDKRAYDKFIYTLEDLGIKIIICENCDDVYPAISSHPDIFYFHYEDNLIFAAPNSPRKTTEELKKLGFNIIFGEKAVLGKYPEDVKYNIAKVGTKVFHNFKFTDRIVAKRIEDDNLQRIHIKQGYSKCSILIVNSNTIITSDKGIYKKALENGIDSLLISPGFIKLEGLNYGFIGGCGGLISKNIMAFNGDISMHPDYLSIKNFLKKYDIEILNVAGLQLSDIGSIIPLCQE